jgi:hypothetical protein
MRRSPLGQLILGLWLIGLPGSAGPLPEPGFLQSYDLKSLPSGGYSALHVSDAGTRAVVLTDKGDFLRLQIERDAGGRITGVSAGKLQPVIDTSGRPVRDGQSDTEGLAMAEDGRAWISTEGTARVMAFDQMGGTANRMPRPKVFALFPPNEAFEAIAISPKGQLWLVPEAPLRGDFPVFVWSGKDWRQEYTLPRRGFWLVSDASFDDKGRFYLLERFFGGPAGFATRIRRFDVGPDGPTGETVVLKTALGTHDNLEGLSIWRQNGGLVASMVSDDNFLKLFREELVEYRLPD